MKHTVDTILDTPSPTGRKLLDEFLHTQGLINHLFPNGRTEPLTAQEQHAFAMRLEQNIAALTGSIIGMLETLGK